MSLNLNELREKAMNQMKVLEPIIRTQLDTYYRKPYELECRIKTDENLLRKQAKYPEKYGDDISKIPDVLGFRISAQFVDDCPLIANLIEEHFYPNRLLDYYNKPKESGFQAYLYYFTNQDVNMEIQIMTQKMRDWTNLTHYEHELRKYYGTVFIYDNNKTK